MDAELARTIVNTAARSRESLGALIPLLKEHCAADEYEAIAKAIASVIGEISVELIDGVYKLHPEIEGEFQARLERFGRSYY